MFLLKVPGGNVRVTAVDQASKVKRMIMKKQLDNKKKKKKNGKGRARGKHKQRGGVIVAGSEVLSHLCFSWKLHTE